MYLLGLCDLILVVGCYRSGFYEKLLQVSPMSNNANANASHLQGGPASGKDQDHQ